MLSIPVNKFAVLIKAFALDSSGKDGHGVSVQLAIVPLTLEFLAFEVFVDPPALFLVVDPGSFPARTVLKVLNLSVAFVLAVLEGALVLALVFEVLGALAVVLVIPEEAFVPVAFGVFEHSIAIAHIVSVGSFVPLSIRMFN